MSLFLTMSYGSHDRTEKSYIVRENWKVLYCMRKLKSLILHERTDESYIAWEIQKIYGGLQCLPNICPTSAQCLPNVCPMSAQCLSNVCPMSVQCLPNVFPMSAQTQCPYSMFSSTQCSQCLPNVPKCLLNVVRSQISDFFWYVNVNFSYYNILKKMKSLNL